MKQVLAVALTLALGVAAGFLIRRGPAPPAPAAAADPRSCIGCHETRQPGLMAQWYASEHSRQDVACEDCHGDDHDAMFARSGRVPAKMCEGCHPDATIGFKQSVHARALPDASRNARLLAQIPAVQRRGCLGCHDMGGPGGGNCGGCHGAHRFSAADAREPEACGSCHMGPDHPQIEAWEASRHGVVFRATRDDNQAPTCVTCHMPQGTHDVSGGITIGRAGSGSVLAGETPPVPMRILDPEEAVAERARMLARCTPCHSERNARRALEDADAVKREADRLLGEAARIVRGLYDDGLLDPMPEDRLGHPTEGHALVLGGPMLYERHSDAERIFFDLAKFAHAITYKGAYHQSADHTHWLGMARLKASLEELRAEERRLRRAAGAAADR